MGFLDKIFKTEGSRRTDDLDPDSGARGDVRDPAGRRGAAGRDPDEVAVERYQYMLRTAPPETIEQAHAEAFAKLSPEQRRQVLSKLSGSAPEAERAASDDPQSLARMATRAEMREPGAMERSLGGRTGGGPGMGSLLAGSLLASVAGAFIGTAIADAFLDEDLATADAAGGGDADTASEDATSGEADPAPDETGFEGEGVGDPGLGDLGGMDDVGI